MLISPKAARILEQLVQLLTDHGIIVFQRPGPGKIVLVVVAVGRNTGDQVVGTLVRVIGGIARQRSGLIEEVQEGRAQEHRLGAVARVGAGAVSEDGKAIEIGDRIGQLPGVPISEGAGHAAPIAGHLVGMKVAQPAVSLMDEPDDQGEDGGMVRSEASRHLADEVGDPDGGPADAVLLIAGLHELLEGLIHGWFSSAVDRPCSAEEYMASQKM